MKIPSLPAVGVGLDYNLNLSYAQEASVAERAARLGYGSVWTPETPGGFDSFQLCALRWSATRAAVPNGLMTGIGVSPVGLRTPVALAMSAGTTSGVTDGHFILGIGSGAFHDPGYRRNIGLPPLEQARPSPLSLMRDYLATVQRLLSGEVVEYRGTIITLSNISLRFVDPPPTPVYLGALGPEMLRLGGEMAEGIVLNWCTKDRVVWSRDRIAEGALRVGRDPREVQVAGYIRFCIDEDVALARQSFSKAFMRYALRTRRASAYRQHFEDMGFGEVLTQAEKMRDQGASEERLIEFLPSDLLQKVGYYGPPAGVPEAFHRLSRGLDLPIVRLVAARSGVEHVLASLEACRPSLIRGQGSD